MSSYYLAGAGQTTSAATTTTTTYGFDLEIELLKSTSASIRASTYSSSSCSLNSTTSESSNSLSPTLSICTRKSRTPRKRPNQTYNEAAALLSTAYPNVFSPKYLIKPPSFKFSKPTATIFGQELLLPDKPLDPPRFGLVRSSSFSNFSDSSSSDKPCHSPMALEDDDFDTESILDEEIGGIDGVMGKLTVTGDNRDNDQHQQTSNFCYGIPMGLGLGLGLVGGRFDFGFGMTRGVRAFRNSSYGGAGEWWRCPAMTTVNVDAISPRLETKPAIETKKPSGCNSKKKKKVPYSDAVSISDRRIQLKLNYEEVLSAWSDRGSPFSDNLPASELGGSDVSARLAQIDLFGENEASVKRYKDKRKTRLISKKIEYQVKKVNADQRLRVKGRFVRNQDSNAGDKT